MGSSDYCGWRCGDPIKVETESLADRLIHDADLRAWLTRPTSTDPCVIVQVTRWQARVASEHVLASA